MDSSTPKHKISTETLTEPRAKRLCGRTESLSSTCDLFENLECLSDLSKTLRSFPRIDLMVLLRYHEGDRLNHDELEATEKLQDNIKKKWSSVKKSSSVKHGPRQHNEGFVKWSDDELWWNPSTQSFKLPDAQISDKRHSMEYLENSLREYGFLNHISSSLLLYRLTLLMGGSESISTDGYKSCWEVRFYHIDGFTFLRLWDSKGGTEGIILWVRAVAE
ncbi:unnamed protein product [Penicillium camemberti]|uniref:Str. FM013 n=1 Tax=Penicillium camemberti (strain FM 013) TaxID=1429867 RepID=A0A0G4PB47_PENC3|nr:unnamed protein product [Penicillium camemberti]